MPREPKLLGYQGQMLAYYSEQFRADTPAFQQWLDTESRPAYLRWLRTAMAHRTLAARMDVVMARPFWDYYLAGIRQRPLANDLTRFFDDVQVPFSRWPRLALVPFACVVLSRRIRFADLWGLGFLAAVYATAFITFHADTGELERHMILPAALYRMAPLLAFAGAWERLTSLVAARWRTARRST
jgi:hypothetical protein